MFGTSSQYQTANKTIINSQSLEDTQVEYIPQKYTLDKKNFGKYTLEQYTLKKLNFWMIFDFFIFVIKVCKFIYSFF